MIHPETDYSIPLPCNGRGFLGGETNDGTIECGGGIDDGLAHFWPQCTGEQANDNGDVSFAEFNADRLQWNGIRE